jgi:putative FmdB family regulatory protein
MPRYQFICLDCDESFEEKRPFAQASDPATCPACQSEQTRKLLSVVAFKVHGDSIPVTVPSSGGCCGGGSCGCHH